jgi:cell division protein FtsB
MINFKNIAIKEHLNKYTITLIIFLIWMLFFDRNDLFTQYKLWADYKKLEKEKLFYINEIEKDAARLKELKTNRKTLEKFSRERYLMKRDNEEIFIITKE